MILKAILMILKMPLILVILFPQKLDLKKFRTV